MKKSPGLLTCFLFVFTAIDAQTADIVVQPPKNKRLVKYFPYSTIRVIDNRPDTTKIYTAQTGIYPPQNVNFSEPASVFIKKYFDSSVSQSVKGSGELLINIEQLYISNIHHSLKRYLFKRPLYLGLFGFHLLLRKTKRVEYIRNSNPRAHLYLQATVWHKNEQGNYNKLFIVKEAEGHNHFQFDNNVMHSILDDCIKFIAGWPPGSAIDSERLSASQKFLLSTRYLPAHEENNIPFEQINMNVRSKWKDYPVVKESNTVPGICYVFDDFKISRITPANIQLACSTKDSLYHITGGSDSLIRKQPHWGVYDGANWYINLTDRSYFKLNRQGDTFGFYIPRNMPDMYALLSIQENQLNYSSSSLSGSGGGGLLIGLAAFLAMGAIDYGVTNSVNNKMEKRLMEAGLKHNYRYCTLNMESGDIIYQDH